MNMVDTKGWKHPDGESAEAKLTDDQKRIRQGFIDRRGYWADDWQLILELAPEVMEAYTDVSAYAWENGSLDAKTREFMYIATTSIVTHIHPIGIETHGRNALKAGASPEELVALLALMGGVGIRGYLMAIEVMHEVAPGAAPSCPPERVEALSARYADIFGERDSDVERAISADPNFFEAFLKWAAAPRQSGILDAKTVALISIAANATITHLDRWTLKREIKAALAMGVTPAQIIEVCSMTAMVSVHSLTVGVPIIAELMKEGERA